MNNIYSICIYYLCKNMEVYVSMYIIYVCNVCTMNVCMWDDYMLTSHPWTSTRPSISLRGTCLPPPPARSRGHLTWQRLCMGQREKWPIQRRFHFLFFFPDSWYSFTVSFINRLCIILSIIGGLKANSKT